MSVFVRRSLTLGLAAVLTAACGTDSPPDRGSPPTEGYVESSDGVQLYYRTLGSGADTVVALHGGPGFDMGYLAPDLKPLTGSHTLLFYDQRGAGRSTLVSDSASLNLTAHVADLEAVRRHFDIDQMTLLGHSWGALLAARYALTHPGHVDRLVFASPAPIRHSPYIDQFLPTVTRWMDSSTLAEARTLSAARDTASDRQAACRAFWRVFVRGYFADPADTAIIQRMQGDFCNAPDSALRNRSVVDSLTMESMGEWDWRDDFAEVRVPVLVITGSKDINPKASAREWEAAFPNARLVLLEGAGHYPQVEQSEQFFRTVRDFLR